MRGNFSTYKLATSTQLTMLKQVLNLPCLNFQQVPGLSLKQVLNLPCLNFQQVPGLSLKQVLN